MPKPGDRVKIITEDKELEGTLMPRPEILKKDVTIIKLDNGYNIGIENKKIKKTEITKEYKEKNKKQVKIKQDPKLPTIAMISLGGTIASRVDYKTGGVKADLKAEDYVQMFPELQKIANVKTSSAMTLMSEDMTPDDWLKAAKAVEKALNDKEVTGVVITQGTDTLHYTTAALSLMLKKLNKPVIITAAQRSIDRGSSDAMMNLICAVTSATRLDAAEVMSCLHGTINDDYCLLNRGTKVRKMHTSRRDTFRPINDFPIAKVYQDGKIEVINKNYRKRNNEKAELYKDFEKNIALITTYPGMDPKIFDFYIKNKKGIVIAATGLGNLPSYILQALEKAIKADLTIIIASQPLYGRVHPLVYSNLRELSIKLGCIFAEDMTPETAYVKLGIILPLAKNKEQIKELFLKDFAGEITTRSLPKTFLY